MKAIIASYPRSGQSYLQSTLSLAFGKQFGFSHLNKPGQIDELTNYDHVITIVRNPVDSISSIVAMELEFNKDLEIDYVIRNRIDEYINFYSFVLKNADTFIDFNNIVNEISMVIKYLSVITKFAIINSSPKDLVRDTISQKFLKSSKKTKHYDDIVNTVSSKDLSKCTELYNSALGKCVPINAV